MQHAAATANPVTPCHVWLAMTRLGQDRTRPESLRLVPVWQEKEAQRKCEHLHQNRWNPLGQIQGVQICSNMFEYVRLPSRSSQSPGHQKLTPELPLRAPSAITRSSRNARLFSSSLVFFFNFAQGSTSWQALECQREAKQDTKKKVCMTKPYNAKASACLVHSNVGNRRDFERCGDGLRDTFSNREASIGDADCRHDHGISQGLFVGIWLNIIMYILNLFLCILSPLLIIADHCWSWSLLIIAAFAASDILSLRYPLNKNPLYPAMCLGDICLLIAGGNSFWSFLCCSSDLVPKANANDANGTYCNWYLIDTCCNTCRIFLHQ